MNNKLKGIVIDPGHGGSDSGAIGNNTFEKDFSLKISKYMYNRLKELGVPVTLTRDTDITLSPTERVNKILNAYGNSDDVILISNHLNAGGGTGAEVIYALRNPSTLANMILENIGLTGQKIRRAYQRTLPNNPQKDYYFLHRNTGNIEPLIVEYGFIDDSKSNFNFLNNNYKELAEAVIKSLADYTGFTYTAPGNNNENTYIVQKGDTLYSIAKKYNTTVNDIKGLNNLTNDNLEVGQIIQLPISNIFNTYIVKAGDTLYQIATQNNTTVDKIKNLNNLTSNTLSIGQELFLPNMEFIDIITTDTNYRVKEGDTLYSIAKIFNTSIKDIKQINNLQSDILSIGQVLKIPVSTSSLVPTSTISYIVQPGDTLYSIARKYNTTVNTIKNQNNLVGDLLVVGDSLLIS